MSTTTLLHPLTHNGTSQTERLLTAVLPDEFQLDERNLKDLLVAAHRYSQLLHYYDKRNTIDGDWTCFWEVEALTFLAMLAELDTEVFLQTYNALEIDFSEDISEGAGGPLDPGGEEITNAYDLANFIYELALKVNNAYHKLPDSLPLKAEIAALIDKKDIYDGENLVEALQQLIAIHKHAYGKEHDGNPLPYGDYKAFIVEGSLWGLEDGTAFEAIKFTGEYDRESLRNLFRRFYEVLVRISHRASYWFDRESAEPKLHQPHVALFLTFLRLFAHAQNSLNALTKKHLDHYYENILCIARRAAVPDDVYLVLELAKGFENNRIEKGTEFLAGKDKNGKPLIFTALEEYVVRGATVAELKTVHFDLCKPADEKGKILANPDVNLAYANGEEDPAGAVVSWRSMGDNEELPLGDIGFAIASPQLILREGLRVIDVEMKGFVPTSPLPEPTSENAEEVEKSSNAFLVQLSTSQNWIIPSFDPSISFDSISENTEQNARFTYRVNGNTLHFRIILQRDVEPVLALNTDTNKYSTEWPIFKLSLKNIDTGRVPLSKANLYNDLRNLKVDQIIITVDVSGVRENLIVQSDQGVFDGTQKVLPFGAVPGVGRKFYVGSTEVFQKALIDLKVQFDWVDIPRMNSFQEYYSHYNTNLFRAPAPEAQIEFLDRASGQDLNIVQVNRNREVSSLSTSFQLRLKITNKENEPVASISALIVSPDDGSVSITNPSSFPKVDNNGEYTFSLNIQEEPENIEIYISDGNSNNELEARFLLRERGLWSRDLDLVLFPKQIKYNSIGANGLSGFIGSFSGEGIGGVIITSVSNSSTSNENGNYEGLPLGNDSELIINDQQQLDLNRLSIEHKKFNVISGYLSPLPEEVGDTIIKKVLPYSSTANTLIKTTPTDIDFILSADGISISSDSPQTLSANALIKAERVNYQTVHFPLEHAKQVSIKMQPISSSILIDESNSTANNQIEFKFKFNGADVAMNGLQVLRNQETTLNTLTNGGLTFTDLNELDTNLKIISNHFTTAIRNESDDFVLGQTWIVDLIPTSYKEVYGPTFLKPFTDPNDILDFQVLVIDDKGSPVADAVIMAKNDNDFLIIHDSDEDGLASFVNTELNSGNWTIFAGKKALLGEVQQYSAASPSISASLLGKRVVINIGLVEKTRDFTGTLEGKVTWPISNEEGRFNPIERALVKIQLSSNGELQIERSAVTDENGLFSITGLPGSGVVLNRELIVQHPYFEETSQNRISFTDNSAFEIKLLQPKEILTGHSGSIKDIFGTVQDNIPIAIPYDSSIEAPLNIDFFLLGYSDENGEYIFAVPEGTEHVYFNPTGQLGYKTAQIPLITTSYNTRPTQPSTMDIVVYPNESLRKNLFSGNTILSEFEVPINALNIRRDTRTQSFERYDPTLKRGFLVFTLLETDFGHHAYPNLLTKCTLELSQQSDEEEPAEETTTTIVQATNSGAVLDAQFGNQNAFQQNLGNFFFNRPLLFNDSSPKTLPNPPYTPATNGISIDYSSRQVIEIGKRGEEDAIDQYFHLLPFDGYRQAYQEEGKVNLLNPFHPHDLPTTTQYADGNLYIGLENLEPDTILSLLFQIEEGTERKPDWLPPQIIWSYLEKGNQWTPFRRSGILNDGTNGLTKGGLVKLKIPKTIVRENTMLNPALHWIRVAAVESRKKGTDVGISESVHALPSLVSVRAQAIQVRFTDRENDLAHLAEPLKANTLSKLLTSRTAIKKVEQPYDSFNGRLPEEGNEFYRRVSERLRHRDRAISVWDYERLLLEQFPKVRRVKCLPHTKPVGSIENCSAPSTTSEEANLSIHKPGYVTLVVLPDLAQRKATLQSEPRFSSGDLGDMATFLRQHANLFVGWSKDQYQPLCTDDSVAADPGTDRYLWVINPTYEYIRLCFNVAFYPGLDATFYRSELNKELKNFLAPWLTDPTADISFDRSLYQSAIIAFIEQREYVDVIGDFRLYMSTTETNLEDLSSSDINKYLVDEDFVCPSAPGNVLTTFELSDPESEEPDHYIEVSASYDDICKEQKTDGAGS